MVILRKLGVGLMIQLMAHNPAIDELFNIIKQASETWDGKQGPNRLIDWSTGKPVVKPVEPDGKDSPSY